MPRLDGSTVTLPASFLKGVALISPDGRSVLHYSGSILEMFAADTGQLRWRTQRRLTDVARFSFSHDGRMLAAGGNSASEVWLFEAATGQALATLRPAGNPMVISLKFSPDDQILAVGYGRHALLWNLKALRQQLASLGLDW